MSARASLAVPALALGACFSIGPICAPPAPPPICAGPVVCVEQSTTVVRTARFDFESPCTISSCGGQVTTGTARLTASIHPSLAAVELDPASSLALEATIPAAADGATVSANVRCDPGGALFFLGDEASVRNEPVDAETGWTARQWILRSPTRLFASLSDAHQSPTRRHLRFANRGTAPCAIDSVVFRISATVCWQFCQQPDSGRADPVDVSSPRQDATTDSPRVEDARSDGDAADPETSVDAGNDARVDSATDADAPHEDAGLDEREQDAGLDAESPG